MLPLSPDTFSLTDEQRFHLERVRREMPKLTRAQLEELAYQAAVLCEHRQSVIRDLILKMSGLRI